MNFFAKTGPLAVMLALASAPGLAHVNLETPQAPVGARYKGVLRVTHGCAGSPTIRVRVRIPDGFIGVKPMPKAGWTLETVRKADGMTADPTRAHASNRVSEIVWSGGPLPGDWYDEFVFIGAIDAALSAGATLYFPVVQDCETGTERWDEIPTGGEARRLKSPAPGLELTAPASAHRHHH